ncbi:MAG: hypothetical protein E6H54_14460 [Betaproteobacteria bacterium]|nr:MAG: hypothetical protein E6H54_14460 [Betaproteobacteria bacterium]
MMTGGAHSPRTRGIDAIVCGQHFEAVAREAGFDHYFTRPATLELLLAALAQGQKGQAATAVPARRTPLIALALRRPRARR